MADENNNSQTEELSLDEVVKVVPEELSDEQKTFLQENTDDLTGEQKETFKDVLGTQEEDLNPDEIEPEVRIPSPTKKTEEKSEEDDEVLPEDEEMIGKVVEKKTKDLKEAVSKIQRIENQADVDSFLRVKPEFGKYREVALKYMSHPAYSNVPVHNIMAIVSSGDMQKLGAQKEREAAKKAKDTQSKGNQTRQSGSGEIDWKKASPEEFTAQRAKVLGQQG